MTTLLLANNTVLLRALSRSLGHSDPLRPVLVHTPDWLLSEPRVQPPKTPIDFALLDCSATERNRRELLETLCSRFSPRRWILMASSGDAQSMHHAVRLGARGCLLAPASADLVAAAMCLVKAGGQCFPKPGPAWGPAVGFPPVFSAGSTAWG